MAERKVCCICEREGHRSHACPLGKYRQIDDETAARIALALHESDPDALFKETALRLHKADQNAVLCKFLELMEPTCTDSPSSPLH